MTEPQDPFAVPDQPSGQQTPGSYPPPPPPPPPDYQPNGYGQAAKTNTMAIIALIAAVLCSPLGIILGFVAKNQIKQRGEGGNGLATAAVIVGSILLLLGILRFAGAFGDVSGGSGY